MAAAKDKSSEALILPTLDEDIQMKIDSVRGVHGAGPLSPVHHDIIVKHVMDDVRSGAVSGKAMTVPDLDKYIRSVTAKA
jgi:hypothetical protein